MKSVDVQWVCHTADSTSCDLSEGDVILERGTNTKSGKSFHVESEKAEKENSDKVQLDMVVYVLTTNPHPHHKETQRTCSQ